MAAVGARLSASPTQDVAIIDGTTHETRNYVQLARDRDGVATALQGMGSLFAGAGGDGVVGLLSPNHCDYYAAVMGTLRAGLTVTPMNPACVACVLRWLPSESTEWY